MGRLLDHLHLRTTRFEASRRFYAAICESVGIPLVVSEEHFYADELWVDRGETPSHIHFAFRATSREMVDNWYAAGLAAGGIDNGPPGERNYHPGYYAAFLLDPDGNNIEAVFHGAPTK